MSSTERRHAAAAIDSKIVLAAMFLLGALLSAGIAVLLAVRSGDDGTERATTAAASASPAPTTATPSPTPASPSPSTAAQEDLQRALGTKPLSQLEPGDRVVYNMVACHFRRWVGPDTETALIACPDEDPFQVEVEYLVPVERGD